MTTWNLSGMQRHLLICNGSTCMGAGGEEITQSIRQEIKRQQLDPLIHTSRTRCNGRCKDKCVVIDYPKGNWYSVPNTEIAKQIVNEAVKPEHYIYKVEEAQLQQINTERFRGVSKNTDKRKSNQVKKKAILFVGHGSKFEQGNEEVRQFIQQLKRRIKDSLLVETCFLEFARPNIEEGIEICVEKGADEVYVIPIILLHAGHSKLHIPAEIEHAKEHFPDVTFTYGQTIGIHEAIIDILLHRLSEVGFDLTAKHEEIAILCIARGGSDPGANSDFYKITRLLWEKLDVKIVESAFMGVTKPSVPEGIERCLKLGAKKVIVLPYFLFSGILMNRMQKMTADFSDKHSDVSFELAKYFGYHSKLQDVLLERMQQALDGTSTGLQDLENFRKYAQEHGYEHHHHH
ncbi:sirohydrochlorin cobaltochelatase [Bacillus ectoiniformans]|uniref:CbiX/SirB N-terminal domain-containing protein n=1 Tax=Bacillus ectoiniformans TaxID=1494429 RepID=UPI001958EE6B|nr:CbiX/SirB N-terminal domain-containing protein [Bacillus ectoiniformans]MBM7647816.1 sirohydrochlorin cobaltochelatase [Bacillus ectoiniformans]